MGKDKKKFLYNLYIDLYYFILYPFFPKLTHHNSILEYKLDKVRTKLMPKFGIKLFSTTLGTLLKEGESFKLQFLRNIWTF